MNKIFITWEEVFSRLEPCDISGVRVYGIPNGGMIAAGFLRHATRVPTPSEADVIIDDVMESGTTIRKYTERFPDKNFLPLFEKSDFPSGSWLIFPWEAAHPGIGDASIKDNIVRQLQYIGEDPSREGLLKTPDRVVRAWEEIFKGYGKDPAELFTVFEKDGYDSMVLLRNIELYSTCEHHLLPFYGKAHVAYIPGKKVVGISKLARLVDVYARRLQIQERICEQVTSALDAYLKPQGAACVIEATHMCMTMRGVGKQNSIMVTSSLVGAFREDQSVREEFMNLIRA